MSTEHIVLVGDSILDNIEYVGINNPDVVKQLNTKIIDLNWSATNCAVDGAITEEIIDSQINTIPKDVTSIILSSGGNDALYSLYELYENPINWLPWNFLYLLYKTRQNFDNIYSKTLNRLKQRFPNSKIICCTIYYPIFIEYNGLIQVISNIGINIMANVITKCALKYGNIPIIDLRYIFDKKEDYANSIEPGVPGGDKITNNIIHILQNHNFNQRYSKSNQITYKLREYSDGINPYCYSNTYWKRQNIDKQHGSAATIFFRRAFNERENGKIKFYSKCGIISLITISTAYFVRRFNHKRKF